MISLQIAEIAARRDDRLSKVRVVAWWLSSGEGHVVETLNLSVFRRHPARAAVMSRIEAEPARYGTCVLAEQLEVGSHIEARSAE